MGMEKRAATFYSIKLGLKWRKRRLVTLGKTESSNEKVLKMLNDIYYPPTGVARSNEAPLDAFSKLKRKRGMRRRRKKNNNNAFYLK
mmetsp:Transcript_15499/g.31086  ORF Transcript_15499/g.31086 Transcript_15499/m.31086 type:complete len:87 (+) Transcript_15499:209-469(+)